MRVRMIQMKSVYLQAVYSNVLSSNTSCWLHLFVADEDVNNAFLPITGFASTPTSISSVWMFPDTSYI